ncbi:KTSC domain-containing protein [Mycolicibacterium sp.]
MSRIERHPVPAKGIVSIGYDRDSRIMEIEFESGDLLTCADIPELYTKG